MADVERGRAFLEASVDAAAEALVRFYTTARGAALDDPPPRPARRTTRS